MILLAGGTSALLEGLAQALSASGQRVVVVPSLPEASDLLSREPAILTVAERGLLAETDAARVFLRGVLGGGSALVTYREAGDTSRALPPAVARHILADLVLPLERTRLVALAEHVVTRAKAVGRSANVTHPDPPAS